MRTFIKASVVFSTVFIVQLALFAWAFSSDKAALPAGMTMQNMSFEGHIRSYYIYLPSTESPGSTDSNKARPLVLAFHGYRQTPLSMMKMTGFNRLAARYNVIVVYPQAEKLWNTDAGPDDTSNEDVDYVSALITHLKTTLNVDANRIDATGFSNGGFFTQRLACRLSDQIAAFASVSATMGRPMMQDCRPTHPVNMLMLNGTHDPIVTWQGEIKRVKHAFPHANIVSVAEMDHFWATYNHCNATAQPYSLSQSPSIKTNPVLKTDYGPCDANASVMQYAVTDGGHTWPGPNHDNLLSRFLVGKTNHALDASSTIFDFFQTHPLSPAKETAFIKS